MAENDRPPADAAPVSPRRRRPGEPELVSVAGGPFPLRVRKLGVRDCGVAEDAMRRFTARRGADCPDEVWLLEHSPVFTLGHAARPEHVLSPGQIPVIRVDRGGQVTYHGPGQLVVYLLLDLRRRGIGIRRLIATLEQAVIDMLRSEHISARRRPGAPGVYVAGKKIAALGLRVRRGCCYHGLAVNVEMDLEPFARIDPCGFPGLEITQLRDLGITWSVHETGRELLKRIGRRMGYHSAQALAYDEFPSEPFGRVPMNGVM